MTGNMDAAYLEDLARNNAHAGRTEQESWGQPYFVSKSGLDTNDGKSWDKAFLTPAAAYAVCVANSGNIIHIGTGTYDMVAEGQDGLTLGKAGIILDGIGRVVFINSDTTNAGSAVSITANDVTLRNIALLKGEATSDNSKSLTIDGVGGLPVTARLTNVKLIVAKANHIAMDVLNGGSFIMISDGEDISAIISQVVGLGTGIYIQDGAEWVLSGTSIRSLGIGVRSGASSLRGSIDNSVQIINCAIGVQLDLGSTYIAIDADIQGFTDLDIADNSGSSTNNYNHEIPAWSVHEEIYPASNGEGDSGAPIAVTNLMTDETGAQDDQNYWGSTFLLVPVDTITRAWFFLGANFAATVAAKLMEVNALFMNNNTKSLKDGGNGWDEGETVLSVIDGTLYQTSDLVWIRSDEYPNGEVLRVVSVAVNDVTIERELAASARTGVRLNHVTNVAMFLVQRPVDPAIHGMTGSFTSASTREAYRWIAAKGGKLLYKNTGCIFRLMNQDDAGAAGADVSVIYQET